MEAEEEDEDDEDDADDDDGDPAQLQALPRGCGVSSGIGETR